MLFIAFLKEAFAQSEQSVIFIIILIIKIVIIFIILEVEK